MISTKLEYVFTHIYDNYLWSSTNKESRSGSDSNRQDTLNIQNDLNVFIKKYDIKRFVDAPCGDFNWMCNVFPIKGVEYFGIDIIGKCIKQLKLKYNDNNVNFLHDDFTHKNFVFPKNADMLFCRNCLFHLSFHNINQFFENFKKSDIKYLFLTSHIREDVVNVDVVDGGFRYMNLFKFPFDFPNDYLDVIYEKEKANSKTPRNVLYLFSRKMVLKGIGNFQKNLEMVIL